jgi:cytochrome c553
MTRHRLAFIATVVGLTAGLAAQGVSPQLVQMRHHFQQVNAIRDAVIRGDLSAAQMAAIPVARLDTPPAMPAAAASLLKAVQDEGRKAATAATLDVAARATASLLNQCGECHHAASVYVAPDVARKPDVGGLVGHMLDHQRGSDDMLLGLIVPSPSLWRMGAERISGDTIDPAKLPKDPKLTSELRKAEGRLHQLAREAQTAVEPEARVESYARLLTTCAACHSVHSRIWGPGRGGQ